MIKTVQLTAEKYSSAQKRLSAFFTAVKNIFISKKDELYIIDQHSLFHVYLPIT